MFHKCPLNNLWDCTATCDVTYLAHTLNNSYPTSACMWVLYKAIKAKCHLRTCTNCVVYAVVMDGGSKAISFRPTLCILMLGRQPQEMLIHGTYLWMNTLRYFLEEFPCRNSAIKRVTMLRDDKWLSFIGLVSEIFILLWGHFNVKKKRNWRVSRPIKCE